MNQCAQDSRKTIYNYSMNKLNEIAEIMKSKSNKPLFKIEDKIKTIRSFCGEIRLKNKTGVIKSIKEEKDGSTSIGIEFDHEFPFGHNLDGEITSSRGYWGEIEEIELN